LNGNGDTVTIEKCNELLEWINDPKFIMDLYSSYKDNPLIRWKDSISKDLSKLPKVLLKWDNNQFIQIII